MVGERNNVAIYPYDFEFLPVLKNRNLLKDINIKYLVAPTGFGLENKDGYYFDDSDKTGFIIKSELTKEELEDIDAIWITETIQKLSFDDFKTAIKKICVYGKKILCTANLNDVNKEELEKACINNNVELITTKDYIHKYNMINNESVQYSLDSEKINTPIITVMGVSPMTQKFDIQLYLRREFLKKGFTVSQIGTKPLCETMGFYSMPDYFFNNKYTEVDKILLFNKFVKEIEIRENPDVIIIGIPDCIVPLTEKHHFNYGIQAYEIFNAIRPDYTILSLLDGLYNDEFFEQMEKLCNYKFNIELDGLFISKYRPVSNSIDRTFLTFTHTKGTKNSSNKYKVFNADSLNNEDIINDIIKKLSMYAEFEIV